MLRAELRARRRRFAPNLNGKDVCKSTLNANRLIWLLERTFFSGDVSIWKKLYTPMVRPHSEYSFKVCSLHIVIDISSIKRIQRRAKIILDFLKNILKFENTWGPSCQQGGKGNTELFTHRQTMLRFIYCL